MIEQTLSCKTGRWILSAQTDSGVEMSLSCVEAGDVKRYVIDRTFLDERDGVRWVIDYKTAEPAVGESLPAFETRQRALYRDQLNQYAHLLKAYYADSEAPITMALYFPSLQHLIECS
jgi:ATP-dependent exoDNAse (exonuclease V) beta subunit